MVSVPPCGATHPLKVARQREFARQGLTTLLKCVVNFCDRFLCASARYVSHRSGKEAHAAVMVSRSPGHSESKNEVSSMSVKNEQAFVEMTGLVKQVRKRHGLTEDQEQFAQAQLDTLFKHLFDDGGRPLFLTKDGRFWQNEFYTRRAWLVHVYGKRGAAYKMYKHWRRDQYQEKDNDGNR